MDSQARHIQARQVLRTGEPYAAISNSPASVGLATLSKQSKSARQPSRVVFDPRTDWEIWLIGLPPKPAWTNLERELWFRAALGVDHVSGRHGFSHLTLAANIGGRRRLIEAVPGSTVQQAELSKYSHRLSARIALRHLEPFGVCPVEFTQRVRKMWGQQYALGKIWRPGQYPNSVICSEVLTRALPADLCDRMYQWLSVHHPGRGIARKLDTGEVILSPNGVAFALNVQPASSLDGPGQEVTPVFLPAAR